MNANNVRTWQRQTGVAESFRLHTAAWSRRPAGQASGGADRADLTKRCCHVFRQGFITSHKTDELRESKRQNICGGQIWLCLKSNFCIRLGAEVEARLWGGDRRGRLEGSSRSRRDEVTWRTRQQEEEEIKKQFTLNDVLSVQASLCLRSATGGAEN